MAAPTVVSFGATSVSQGDASFTIAEPAGAQEGDILLCVGEFGAPSGDGTTNITWPDGWTELGVHLYGGTNPASIGTAAWIRRGASAPDLTGTVNYGNTNHFFLRAIAYRGVPATVEDPFYNWTWDDSPLPPGATTTVAAITSTEDEEYFCLVIFTNGINYLWADPASNATLDSHPAKQWYIQDIGGTDSSMTYFDSSLAVAGTTGDTVITSTHGNSAGFGNVQGSFTLPSVGPAALGGGGGSWMVSAYYD